MPLTREWEFFPGNGSAYIAPETRKIVGPEAHPYACSPQSSGMAESFVDTFKGDYVSCAA